MAKKAGKKAGNFASKYRARDAAPEAAFDKKKSRIRRLETAEDAFGGDEDEFHQNRDSVLFENNGRRKDQDIEDLSEDDEIYALNLPAQSSEEDESAGEEAAVENDEDDDEDEEEDLIPTKSLNGLKGGKISLEAPKGRFGKESNPEQDIIMSDASSDEGYEASLASDEEEAENDVGNSEDDEDQWAAGQYHVSRRRGNGEADSSDDEALDLEAEEARRLQKKMKGTLGGEDFGLGEGADDADWIEEVRNKERSRGLYEDETFINGENESNIQLAALSGSKSVLGKRDWTEEEAIAHLLRNNPETLALLDDFTVSSARMTSVEKALLEVRQGDEDGKEHPALAIMELEHQALSTYLPTLAFFFALLLAPEPDTVLTQKVLARLSQLRTALATMEELDLISGDLVESGEESESGEEDDEESGILASEVWDMNGNLDSVQLENDEEEEEAASDSDDGSEDSSEEGEEESDLMMSADEYDSDEEEERTSSMLGGLNDEELEMLINDMKGDVDADALIAKVKQVQRTKQGLPPLDVKSSDVNDRSGGSEQTGSAKTKKKSPKAAANLVPHLEPLSAKDGAALAKHAQSHSHRPKSNTDDYLDPTTLSYTDVNDKASKRHTLRFHVSQINQKARKREVGGPQGRLGGDEDLPRRSKERSRREVLKRQEHGVDRAGTGVALDDKDWDDDDQRAASSVKGKHSVDGNADGDGYYDLVKNNVEEVRAAKKARYDEDRLSERAELQGMADISAAGPRGASRQILSNKGLQPKRAKVNRNPRVKKRLRYDKAVKKVATMKSVYKGGALGEYSGEKSGIGSKVVKSVRLGGK